MKFYTDPNFVVMDFSCPYCDKETTISVHDDGASVCNNCNTEARAPMSYQEAQNQGRTYQIELPESASFNSYENKNNVFQSLDAALTVFYKLCDSYDAAGYIVDNKGNKVCYYNPKLNNTIKTAQKSGMLNISVITDRKGKK